jgi:hypothetical protein
MRHAKYALDDYCYSIQSNNTVESIIFKSGRASYLESCGPNSLENCASAMIHYDILVDRLSVNGEKYQPADLIFTHMNDPLRRREYGEIMKIDFEHDFVNRYAIYYPHVTEKLLGIQSEYVEKMDIDLLKDHISNGNTAQVCLKNPGHYIAIVGVDGEGFYFHDSWPERFTSRDGFYREITKDELLENSHHVMILYYKED